jgi:hypothetical protein
MTTIFGSLIVIVLDWVNLQSLCYSTRLSASQGRRGLHSAVSCKSMVHHSFFPQRFGSWLNNSRLLAGETKPEPKPHVEKKVESLPDRAKAGAMSGGVLSSNELIERVKGLQNCVFCSSFSLAELQRRKLFQTFVVKESGLERSSSSRTTSSDSRSPQTWVWSL